MIYSKRRFVVCLSVCHFVLAFFSPFSIAITSLAEKRATLSATLICKLNPSADSLPHNIQAIANSFIKINKFSELLRKVRFTYNFSKSVH